MAWYMVRPEGHGKEYGMAWWAWHGICYGVAWHGMVHGMAWHGKWNGLTCMAQYMLWPDEGIWYSLVGMALYMVQPGGHGMAYDMAWRT